MTPQDIISLATQGGGVVVTLYLYFKLLDRFDKLLDVVIKLAEIQQQQQRPGNPLPVIGDSPSTGRG